MVYHFRDSTERFVFRRDGLTVIEFLDNTDDDDIETEYDRESKRARPGERNEMVDSLVAKFSQGPQRIPAPASRIQEQQDELASMKDELRRYRLEPRLAPDRNPLDHWRQIEPKYPHVAKQAKKYLAIQASNASSERMNSTLSLTIRNNRASLNPETVGDVHTLREFFLWSEQNPASYHEFVSSL